MSYEVYVSSFKRFTDFKFEGMTYKCITSKIDLGVVYPRNTQGIRVTSLERTVVDSIKDFEKIGGLEELLNCISSVPYLDEKQIIKYLAAYGIQFLYQKTEHFEGEYNLNCLNALEIFGSKINALLIKRGICI